MHDRHSRQLAHIQVANLPPGVRSLNPRHPPGKLACSQQVFPSAAETRARGGIGRRARLRALCPQGRAGSTPVGPSFMQKALRPSEGLFRFVGLDFCPPSKWSMDRREFLAASAAAGAFVLPHALRAAERDSKPKARSGRDEPQLRVVMTEADGSPLTKERAKTLCARRCERSDSATHRARRRPCANCFAQRAVADIAGTQGSRLR